MATNINKGYFTRQIEKCAPNVQSLAGLIQEAGVKQILLQVADGDRSYPVQGETHKHAEEIINEVIAGADTMGVDIWGWARTYGAEIDPISQAENFAARINDLGLSRAVIRAEQEAGHKWTTQAARLYMQTLTNALSEYGLLENTILAISNPVEETTFPLVEFLTACRVIMPYFSLSTTEGSLTTRLQYYYQAYRTTYPQHVIIPVAMAYGKQKVRDGHSFYWTARPDQINEFLYVCASLGIEHVNFWSWQDIWRDQTLWWAIANWTFQEPQAMQPPSQATPVTTQAQATPTATTTTTPTDAAATTPTVPPGEVFLDVPYYSQEASTAVYSPNDCGPACVRMLIGWDRLRKGQEDPADLTIDDVTRAAGIGRSTSNTRQLRAVAQKYNLTLNYTDRAANSMSIETIKREIDAGRPVLCLINYKYLTKRQSDFDGGHFVLAVGYNDQEIILNDPLWSGSRMAEGKGFRVPQREFQDAITKGGKWFSVPQGLLVT
ncbi:MAG: hypothetical protein D6737_02735 [Chloroflexi bacterium]|nr:MAG: hypothetical protein D6737_02735 [Chloroflexota bacterium]